MYTITSYGILNHNIVEEVMVKCSWNFNSREYFGEKIGLYFAWLGNSFNS